VGEAIGNVLPSAIGVALSPVPIIAVILMLATPQARRNGPAFAIGWLLGLTAVSVIVLMVAGGADEPDSGASTTVDVVQLAIGLLFLAMALKQWRARPRAGETQAMPAWMSSIDRFTPGKSLGLGVLLSGVNPKNLALTMAAAASIAQAGLDGAETAIVVAVFVILGSLTVAGPVAYYLVAGDTAGAPLASIKEFMTDNNAVIMMVILLVLGAKLIGSGISGLTA
jgi:threonine/homoserine/homoserine lactone efflux protein